LNENRDRGPVVFLSAVKIVFLNKPDSGPFRRAHRDRARRSGLRLHTESRQNNREASDYDFAEIEQAREADQPACSRMTPGSANK
jgi:hypothetical protein